MGKIWVALSAFLFGVIGPLLAQALKFLGISLVTYVGADLLIEEAETAVLATFDSLPVDLYEIMVMAGVRDGIQILFAASLAFVSIKMWGGWSKWKSSKAALVA